MKHLQVLDFNLKVIHAKIIHQFWKGIEDVKVIKKIDPYLQSVRSGRRQ